MNQPGEITITDQCTITGINKHKTTTLGSITIELDVDNNTTLHHKFQIVDQTFPIPTDGILGRDFLAKYHCRIDYDTWMLTCVQNNEEIEIPIQDNLEGALIIPPRCEVFRQITINKTYQNYVIKSQEIQPGVFCANSIINKLNPLIRIINTTNDTIKLPKHFPNNLEPLENFDIFHINKNEQTNRKEKCIKELNLANTPTYIKDRLTNLCEKYNDIFTLQNDTLTHNNFYKQKINLNDQNPVYIKNYRTPEIHKTEIDKHVSKMLEEKIIRPSVSPFNSPVLLVPKKSTDTNKQWRLVIDFRQLNKKIVADKFPLPRIDEILDQLGRAKYFSTLDLMSGFHQIELNEQSKQYTAFSTTSGHYEYNRLPFGLNIAPNSFQRMMTIALSGLPAECAFLYIDDIIVVGCSITHHLDNLDKVFQKLRKYNLKLNPAKCKFFHADVTYLGHHISEQGVQPDKSKFNAILNYPKPTNSDDTRRFVAFCNYYRRFIPYFAEKTAPLNALLKKKAIFNWTNDCQKAFENLKHELLDPKILQFPDFTKTFILSTDASKVACGAVLEQEHNGIRLPIAFASKKFTKGESNKSTIEQELTAIHWAISHFKPYLFGRKFTVKTDHNPLVHLFSMKDPTSKLTRMRLDLEEFDFDIEYVKGRDNVGADALSRIRIDSKDLQSMSVLAVQTRSKTKNERHNTIETNKKLNDTNNLKAYNSINNIDAFRIPKVMFEINNEFYQITITNKTRKGIIVQAQLFPKQGTFYLNECLEIINEMAKKTKLKKVAISVMDPIFKHYSQVMFKEICNKLLNDVTIIIYIPAQIITNPTEINNLIKENHNTLLGGHMGINKLIQKIRRNYYWPNMKKSITNYVKNCTQCKQNKHSITNKEVLQKTTTPLKPFDLISVDTVGPLTRSQSGNRYALTMQCDLTKYIITVAVPDKQASTLAKAIVEHAILIYGCPIAIKSDMGTEYKNEIIQELCNIFSVNQKFATAYHPETIGALERSHRCLNEYLRHFINEQHDDWDSWLPYFTFYYNTTPHSAHNFAPFELLFGKQANYPNELKNVKTIEPVYNHDLYYKEVKFKLQTAAQKAKTLLEKAKQKLTTNHKRHARPITIKLGDQVWLKKENRRKLDPVYSGPYKITGINHPNATIENQTTKETQTVHKNRLVRQ